MKLFSPQQSSIKKEASPLGGDVVNCTVVGLAGINDQMTSPCVFDNELDEFRIPFEALRGFRSTPSCMIQSKDEELLLRLSELFFFLRRLELRLVDLCLKDSVDLKKLSVLADEVTELKGVAREALAYFHDAAKAVEPPFQPSGNDAPESVDESQRNGSQHHDKNTFGDISPVKPCQEVPHGREDNQ